MTQQLNELAKPDSPTWAVTLLLCVVTGLGVHAYDTREQKTEQQSIIEVLTKQHDEEMTALKALTESIKALHTGKPIGSPAGSHE